MKSSEAHSTIPSACPGAADLARYCAGTLEPRRSAAIADHVPGCEYCSAAVEVLGASDVPPGPEEGEFAASLPSAGAEGRRRIAGAMAKSGSRTVSRWWLAAAAAGVIFAAFSWYGWSRSERGRSAEELYASHRPFGYKFAGAAHGPESITRGSTGVTEAPAELVELHRRTRRPGESAESWAESARADALLLDFGGALDKLERAHRLKPDDPAIANDLAVVLAARAQTRDDRPMLMRAIALWDALLSRDPRNWSARFNRGIAYQYLGRSAEAEAEWRSCLDRNVPAGWKSEIEARLTGQL